MPLAARAWQSATGIEPGEIVVMPGGQKTVALALALFMIIAVLELVRRRKLREEYPFLWFGTAVILLALALEPRLLNLFTKVISAKQATSALFFGALLFLMLVALQFSIRLTKLTFRARSLAQKVSLLDAEVQRLRQDVTARDCGGRDSDSDNDI